MMPKNYQRKVKEKEEERFKSDNMKGAGLEDYNVIKVLRMLSSMTCKHFFGVRCKY